MHQLCFVIDIATKVQVILSMVHFHLLNTSHCCNRTSMYIRSKYSKGTFGLSSASPRYSRNKNQGIQYVPYSILALKLRKKSKFQINNIILLFHHRAPTFFTQMMWSQLFNSISVFVCCFIFIKICVQHSSVHLLSVWFYWDVFTITFTTSKNW